MAGKINGVASENDDFFLDGSVRLFEKTLDDLGLQANVNLLTEGGHETWSGEIRTEMHQKMDESFLERSKSPR